MNSFGDSIAVIGLACRFPGDASSPDDFWRLLTEGRNVATEVPHDRYSIEGFYHPDPQRGGSIYTRKAHFMSGNIRAFDSAFFGITPQDAQCMDPQQRLVLENVYHAFEDGESLELPSGISLEQAAGSQTSVFVGGGFGADFLKVLSHDSEALAKAKAHGIANSLLSNRVSWFYDLKGVSLTIDTACSSSLVAVHAACQSLQGGESQQAVVSGIGVIEHPDTTMDLGNLGLLSPDGRSYSFDHRANGYGRGEGVGSIIIKPLKAAVRDGDRIRAVIRGTGSNQDGRTPGIAMPSQDAQIKLIREVYAKAGLDLQTTSYIEAHGTGTSTGDPIEAGAIARAFQSSERAEPLVIGSVKANVGHLEGAAGIAGVIKAILMVENGIVPPAPGFEKINPRIPIDKWNLSVATESKPWGHKIRRVSINSFGFGGTNAHAVIDDADSALSDLGNGVWNGVNGVHTSQTNGQPIHANGHSKGSSFNNGDAQTINGNGSHANGHTNGLASQTNGHTSSPPTSQTPLPQSQIFILSAFDQAGISRSASTLLDHLTKHPTPTTSPTFLQDLSYTLANKRTKFPWKQYWLADSQASLLEALAQPTEQAIRAMDRPAKLGFVFTGQGAQWKGMGQALLKYSVYRESIKDADSHLQKIGCPWSLVDLLADAKADMTDPLVSQTACTAVQVALVDLLASWKVRPQRVVGHSSGEIAAAYCAGYLTREDAWKIAYYRGLVCQSSTSRQGAMMAVGLSAKDAQATLQDFASRHGRPGSIRIACFNSPKNVTISGDADAIDLLHEELTQKKIFARKLAVNQAYHSHHMEEHAERYLSLIGELSSPPARQPGQEVEMFSSLTGARASREDVAASKYWKDNLISPVRFEDALKAMLMTPKEEPKKLRLQSSSSQSMITQLLEVGPHPALRSAAQEVASAQVKHTKIDYLATLTRHGSEHDLLNSAAKLFCLGHPISLDAINGTEGPGKRLVSLPPYPFNHEKEHYIHSRLSKAYQHRRHPRHDLFGAPVSDWNATSPRWRGFLRVSELPWLKDHVITGKIIFPGAGYMSMAIQAVQTLADPERASPNGVQVKDIVIRTALVVPDTPEGIEFSLSMSAVPFSKKEASSRWRDFSIQSYDDKADRWTEHCCGSVQLTYADDGVNDLVGARERVEREKSDAELFQRAEEVCKNRVHPNLTYHSWANKGMMLGPPFQNLKDTRMGDGTGMALCRMTVPDVAATMPYNYLQEHTIQPCLMDTVFSTFFTAIIDTDRERLTPQLYLPTSIKSVWVSTAIPREPGVTLQSFTKARKMGFNQFESNITARDPVTNDTVVVIKALRCKRLDTTRSRKDNTEHLCRKIEWQPALSLLKKGSTIFNHLSGSPSDPSDTVEYHRKLQLVVMIYVEEALQKLAGDDGSSMPKHFQYYLQWMRHQRSLAHDGKLVNLQASELTALLQDSEEKAKLLNATSDISAQAELLHRCGPYIHEIMTGKKDVLEIMFGQDDIMDRAYPEILGRGDSLPLFNSFLKGLGHNGTNLNILEIGAGTGTTTLSVLEALSPRRAPTKQSDRVTSRIAQYTYTDISAAFLDRGREKFKPWDNVMEFRVLNIENDPEDQDIVAGSYDVVVASAVIHATVDPLQSLRNARKLLKRGGKLFLIEPLSTGLLDISSCFGLLPGWWLSYDAEKQSMGATMTEDQWEDLLTKAGFSGRDLSLKDHEDANAHEVSYMVSTAVESDGPVNLNGVANACTYVVCDDKQMQSELVASLLETLTPGHICKAVRLQDVQNLHLNSSLCVSLLGLTGLDLSALDEATFASIKHILLTAGKFLWVTCDQASDPLVSMMMGIIRTTRWERDVDQPNLTTLEIEHWSGLSGKAITDAIVRTSRVFDRQDLAYERNGEYLYRNDELWTARVVESGTVTNGLDMADDYVEPTEQPFGGDENRPLMLTQTQPGLLNQMVFVDDSSVSKPLGPTEAEFKVEAAGLNMRDILVAMGNLPNTNLGQEGVGTVTRVGSSVTDLVIGDRVATLITEPSASTFRTLFRTSEDRLVKIPHGTGFVEAAAIPVVFITALYALQQVGRLSAGESILIHSAAGGTGQAAIQLAKLAGATIYATVSTEAKKELLVQRYGLSPEHIFSSRDLAFADGILRLTKGRGVDVILSSLSGEYLRASFSCMAPLGRFLELGQRDIRANANLPMQAFLDNVMYYGVNVFHLAMERTEIAIPLLRQAFDLLSKGEIRAPEPIGVFGFDQMETAFRQLQSGQNMGKSVMVPKKEDPITVMPARPTRYRFREDATYVLAGGMSGIGKSLAIWMASRGAKHLVSLSRSGEVNPELAAVAKLLREHGCQVRVFCCDVSDKAQLATVLAECKTSMPPIRGCIQGAMQLSDALLNNMTLDGYMAAVRPKVHGTRNLHELLDLDMDFFVMLSSLTSVLGSRGQSNYAAGNAYQDALAKHLTSNGIRKAVSVNLGSVADVGFVAQKLDEAHRARINVWSAIPEVTLHSILEYAIDARTNAIGQGFEQCVAGLMTVPDMTTKGVPMPAPMDYPMFAQLHSHRDTSPEDQAVAANSTFPVQKLLRECDSMEATAAVVREAIQRKIATMMSMPWEDIQVSKPLQAYGVDSLVATELRAWVSKTFRSEIEILDVLGQTTLAELSVKIAHGIAPV
ncbi:hypothetical protein PRZ48_012762 [Zasmidium cellare]|uniref:Polyketide synthase n=1 Tax=Zasmidium cellare TaxID=395010 RepID=A0ABR0E5U1_ZASCE|nr:hypothetical protein PRZ48_012762 [Zasmidium cellare]